MKLDKTGTMTAAMEVRIGTNPDRGMRRFGPRGLFGKYALTIVGLVVFVLMVNGAIEAYIIYVETTTRLAHAQREVAATIVARTETFLHDVARVSSFATRASSITDEDHRQDYMALLEQVPEIADVTFLDGTGRPRLSVDRHRAIAGSTDAAPDLGEAQGRSAWFSPAAFHGHQASLFLSMTHAGDRAGMTIVRIDLARVFAFIRTIPLPSANQAYVLDERGRVIAASVDGSDIIGRPHTGPDDTSLIQTTLPIATTHWTVVLEEPAREAFRPLVEFGFRFAWLLLFGLTLAVLAGLVLSRRMIEPIKALHEGASHLAANEFDHRIDVRTGDELEELAAHFNRMSGELASSYGRLEQQVEQRTRDLALSVRDLKALEEIGRALASSLDLPAVLTAIVSRAISFTGADAGAVYACDGEGQRFRMVEAQGLSPDLRSSMTAVQEDSKGALDAAVAGGQPILLDDLSGAPYLPAQDAIVAAGFHSALVIGLVMSGETYCALVVYWREANNFRTGTPGAMQTFAHQSVLALHNARLFQALSDRGRQLEVANAHRTQFFANMSHELRTPLNAVLGYSELLHDGLYGDLPERAVGVLDRIQANSKHLLSLINDVLDLTKMEAGALTLSLNEYVLKALIDGVVAATESLARTKGLVLRAEVEEGLPVGRGDDRRLTQVLLNLVGNAIKFTDTGYVEIDARVAGSDFVIAVRDTGPGISEEAQGRIFEEFEQVDDASTRRKGGTGLGLSISRRLVEMHGGRIDVASVSGQGATFTLVIPIRVDAQRQSQ